MNRACPMCGHHIEPAEVERRVTLRIAVVAAAYTTLGAAITLFSEVIAWSR